MDRADQLREVVRIAKEYICEIYSDDKIGQIRLEELTIEPEDDLWLVTIGFGHRIKNPLLPPLAETVYGDRQYKVVHIKRDNGEVVAMTDRMLKPHRRQHAV